MKSFRYIGTSVVVALIVTVTGAPQSQAMPVDKAEHRLVKLTTVVVGAKIIDKDAGYKYKLIGWGKGKAHRGGKTFLARFPRYKATQFPRQQGPQRITKFTLTPKGARNIVVSYDRVVVISRSLLPTKAERDVCVWCAIQSIGWKAAGDLVYKVYYDPAVQVGKTCSKGAGEVAALTAGKFGFYRSLIAKQSAVLDARLATLAAEELDPLIFGGSVAGSCTLGLWQRVW